MSENVDILIKAVDQASPEMAKAVKAVDSLEQATVKLLRAEQQKSVMNQAAQAVKNMTEEEKKAAIAAVQLATAQDKATKETTELANETNKAAGTKGGGGLSTLNDKFKALTGVSLPTAGAIAAVGKALRDSTLAALEAEMVQANLTATLNSTRFAAGLSSDEINKMATDMSKLTGIEDDNIVKGQAMLLTFTKIGKDVFPEATEAMLNMTAKFGSMDAASVQLGKALNDPIAGVTALRRVGVMLTDAQEQQIRSFMAVGDVASAQRVILGELNTEFGGLAEAMGSTNQGKINRYKNAMGNLGEVIGSQITPMIGAAAENLAKFIELIIEMNNLSPETIDSLKREAKSYEEYAAGIRALLEEGNLVIDQYGNLRQKGGRVVEMNVMMTEEQWNLNRSLEASDERLAIVTRKYGEAATSAEDFEAAQEELKNKLEELQLFISDPMGKAIDTFNEKQGDLTLKMEETRDRIDELNERKYLTPEQKDELLELNSQMSDLTGQFYDNATAHEEATKRILFGILEQQLAREGWTELEQKALLAVAEKWGLVGDGTVEAYDKMIPYVDQLEGVKLTAEQFADELAGIPAEMSVTLTVYERRIIESLAKPSNGGHGGVFEAAGGPVSAGQPYIVGERGPERFVPGQGGQIVPNVNHYSVTNNLTAQYSNRRSQSDLMRDVRMLDMMKRGRS